MQRPKVPYDPKKVCLAQCNWSWEATLNPTSGYWPAEQTLLFWQKEYGKKKKEYGKKK